METRKINVITVMTALAIIALVTPGASAFAREAESGGNSGSGGVSVTATTPRADDNPSAADLAEGTRVLVPEASGSDDGLVRHSGVDSARDLFERNLSFGMRGDDGVAHLQRELETEGFFHASATGNFFEMTKQAVMEFQKAHGLPATGFVGPMTRAELNKKRGQSVAVVAGAQSGREEIMRQVQILMEKVKELQAQLNASSTVAVTAAMQAKAGIVITGGVSGPGYPTGPLNMSVAAAQLFMDNLGQVNGLDINGRQYEAPLDTIPPTLGSFPITINGVANNATSIKVISNLQFKNGIGQHQGTIDIDIDTLPGGHLTLNYNGTATTTGSTTVSKGTFKSSKSTGIFTGLVAEGTYEMTIVESAVALGAPVNVTITTISR